MGTGKEQEGREHGLGLDFAGVYDLRDPEDMNRSFFVGLLPAELAYTPGHSEWSRGLFR